MTPFHAYCFCVLGWGLNLLPAVAPSLFPPSSVYGTNTSALWLGLMGWVNGLVGAGYIAHLQVNPVLVRALAWRRAVLPELSAENILPPSMAEGSRQPASERAAA